MTQFAQAYPTFRTFFLVGGHFFYQVSMARGSLPGSMQEPD